MANTVNGTIIEIKEQLTEVANVIREKTGSTDAMPLSSFASKIDSININTYLKYRVETDKSCYDLFRNSTIKNSTDISYLLKGVDISKSTNFASMFYNCKSLTSIPNLDISNGTIFSNMFYNCESLTSIIIGVNINTSKGTSFASMFFNCRKLNSVLNLDLDSAISVTSMFASCVELKNLSIKNIRINLQIGSGTYWGHLLTVSSLLNVCRGCIQQSSVKTLTIGTANKEKLANVYVNPQGYQVDSTVQGAMLVEEYMQLKSWNLA